MDNNSFFAQDHWVDQQQLSADLGLRYERVRSEATGDIVGVDTDTVVPRLARRPTTSRATASKIVHVTYGHYAGRYNEAQIGNNNNVGNPDLVARHLQRPGRARVAASPRDSTRPTTRPSPGQFPTANIFFEDGLSSPTVKEFTTSYGTDLMNGRGYAEGSYIWRNMANVIEDYITLANGATTVVEDGFEVGTFTNIVYGNTRATPGSASTRPSCSRAATTSQPRWTLNGHYTVQLENDGNYEGEAREPAGHTEPHWRLPGDLQRGAPLPRRAAGQLPAPQDPVLEHLQRRAWGASATRRSRPHPGRLGARSTACGGRPADHRDPGARCLPATRTQPSARRFTTTSADRRASPATAWSICGVGYNIPVFRTLRPWVKFDIYNLFNNQKLIQLEHHGEPGPDLAGRQARLRTGYRQGASFGKATANTHFPIPFQGETGGRTWRIAAGFRF